MVDLGFCMMDHGYDYWYLRLNVYEFKINSDCMLPIQIINVRMIQSFIQTLVIISMISYCMNICLSLPTTITSKTMLKLFTAEVKTSIIILPHFIVCVFIDHCTYMYM